MTTDSKPDLSVTTFATVVVEKAKLLQTLEVNRDKHNSIYNTAVSGYWIEAQKVLDKKKIEFSGALVRIDAQFGQQDAAIQANIVEQNVSRISGYYTAYLGFDTSWPLKYPENHLEDYNRAIDLLNFSVADKVELSVQDFDAYVRNNWSWRKSFLGTNVSYVTGCYGVLNACSGYVGFTGYTVGNIAITGGSLSSMARQLNSQF